MHPETQLGNNNVIGPFCHLDKNTVLGNRDILQDSVTVNYGARVDDDNEFFSGASISTKPRDLEFAGEDTIYGIGGKDSVRENVTISRGTISRGTTKVGGNNLLMENVHIAHDCIIGSNVVISNSTKFAGEVTADDCAVISTTVLCHQFCHIGGYVMAQGDSRSSQGIPPYVMADKEPTRYIGINIIRLRRRGFNSELIQLIHQTYRLLYSKGVLKEGIEEIRRNLNVTPETQYIIDFAENSQRGIIR